MSAQTKIVQPTVVNGINVDDLLALIEGVRRDPAKGKTSWRVTTTWQGQARSRAEIESFEIGGEKVPRRFSIDIDEPHQLGGSNGFANPQEHLIAALNACLTAGYAAQCAVRGITSNAWRSRPTARSISAVSLESILLSHRATRTLATPSTSKVTAQRSSSPRSTTR
jgi:organic hydroperoxide reductase OsmC/OhrA